MKIKIFSRKNCPLCEEMKKRVDYYIKQHTDEPAEVITYDVDTVEGLTEAAMEDVVEKIPAVIIDKCGKKIRWFSNGNKRLH